MSSVRQFRRIAVLLFLTVLLVPLLSGCMQRSTTVGDRFSGSVLVATSPDNPRGAPVFDVPASMSREVTVSEFDGTEFDDTGDENADDGESDEVEENAEETEEIATADGKVGTQIVFRDLTTGQFNQLGDIVASAFGGSAISMDLSANRIGGVVRFRGTADLTDLTADRDYLDLTVSFGGPVIATDGAQLTDNTVEWVLPAGTTADLSADSEYADPATSAIWSWSWFMAVVCALAVALVCWLAYRGRDRGPRPGAAPTGGARRIRFGRDDAQPTRTAAPDKSSAAPPSAPSSSAGESPQPDRTATAGTTSTATTSTAAATTEKSATAATPDPDDSPADQSGS